MTPLLGHTAVTIPRALYMHLTTEISLSHNCKPFPILQIGKLRHNVKLSILPQVTHSKEVAQSGLELVVALLVGTSHTAQCCQQHQNRVLSQA